MTPQNPPQLSIIVPVYNKEDFVSECIKSILDQDYTNFELIVVDDGSTDRSTDIVEKLTLHDSRIQFFRIPNQGVSHARNLGLSESNGQYIAFVDADDWIERDMYSSMIQLLETSGSDVVICGYTHEPKGSKRLVEDFGFLSGTKVSRDEVLLDLIHSPFSNGPCNKIYRSNIIRDNEIDFPYGLSKGQDRIFNYRYLDKVRTVTMVNSGYYHYRSVESSSVHRYRSDLFEIELNGYTSMEQYSDSWNFVREDEILKRKRKHVEFIHRNVTYLWHPDSVRSRGERREYLSDMRTAMDRYIVRYKDLKRPASISNKKHLLYSAFTKRQFWIIEMLMELWNAFKINT